jgi:FkbM family methyltransferase
MSRLAAARTLVAYLLSHPIGRRRPARALANLVAWQAQARLSAGPHVKPWIGGAKLVVARHMYGATGNLYLGLHEFGDMAFLLHLLRPDDLFFDIGANVGSYTVLASAVRGAETVAFEPDPATARKLQANIDANAIDGRVAVHQIALGAADGEIAFTTGLDTMNRVARPGEPQRIVPIRRLDEIAAGRVPALIKIDVEGHEDAVFAGAEQVLAGPALQAILTESAGPDTLAAFARHGFERRWYDPFARRLSTAPIDRKDNNSLYVRDTPELRARLAAAPAVKVMGLSI